MTHPIINKVENRFLPLSQSVLKNLEPEPTISDFYQLKTLGYGSFGKVVLAEHKITKVRYAIKIIDKKNKTNIEGTPYFRREIEIMYKLHHSNVVKLYGNFEDNSFIYFVMEYMEKGNLYNIITLHKNMLNTKFVASILKDIISAVYYLHNMNPPIIHRDIKPENVLLGENNIVKLTDFGWSNYINFSGEQRNTYCGTPIYLAPEMILNKGHDERVDIWCIGVLMFELLCLKPPFNGKNSEELTQNILKGNICWFKKIDEDAKDLISKILVANPLKRIGIKEIITHKFFTKFFPNPISFLIKPSNNFNNEPYIISKDVPWKINLIRKRSKINNNSNCNIDKIDVKNRINSKDLSPKNKINKRNKLLNVSYDNINKVYTLKENNYSSPNEYEKLKKSYQEMKNLNEQYKKMIEIKNNQIKDLQNKNKHLKEKLEEIQVILLEKEKKGDNNDKYLNKGEKKKYIKRPTTPEISINLDNSISKRFYVKSKKSKNFQSYANIEPNQEYAKNQTQKFSIDQYSSSNGSICSSTDDSLKFNNTMYEIKKIRENEGKRFSNLENKYKKIIEEKEKEINSLNEKINILEKKTPRNSNKK